MTAKTLGKDDLVRELVQVFLYDKRVGKLDAFQIIGDVHWRYRHQRNIPEHELGPAFSRACGVIIATAREMMAQDSLNTQSLQSAAGCTL
jgi:hypothetical protein